MQFHLWEMFALAAAHKMLMHFEFVCWSLLLQFKFTHTNLLNFGDVDDVEGHIERHCRTGATNQSWGKEIPRQHLTPEMMMMMKNNASQSSRSLALAGGISLSLLLIGEHRFTIISCQWLSPLLLFCLLSNRICYHIARSHTHYSKALSSLS